MGESGVRQRADRSDRTAGLAFDLLASKLVRPLAWPGVIGRSSLFARLARGNRRPIVSVAPPPGYGKTTLLSQWTEADGQAYAWVSVDERDNDPSAMVECAGGVLTNPKGPWWPGMGIRL